MLEVADVVRAAGDDYIRKHGDRLLPSHRRALRDIAQCRTAALGGHVHRCDRCDRERFSDHSCRNRHCPKCEGEATREWLQQRLAALLPGAYSLITVTLPAELRDVARANQKTVYAALMRCAAEAVLKLAADPAHLGAQVGVLAVLHTWTQLLTYHPHVHLLVTAGGHNQEGNTWHYPRNRRWLLPGFAVAEVFRGKFRDALAAEGLLAAVPARAWRHARWVADVEFAGDGERILRYLARYVHRVAISNSRIERIRDGQVTFRYQDRRRPGNNKRRGRPVTRRSTVDQEEFLRRFLLHILPSRFAKIRYDGLLASASKARCERARALLLRATGREPATPAVTVDTSASVLQGDRESAELTDANRTSRERTWPCPFCKRGRMRVVNTIARAKKVPP